MQLHRGQMPLSRVALAMAPFRPGRTRRILCSSGTFLSPIHDAVGACFACTNTLGVFIAFIFLLLIGRRRPWLWLQLPLGREGHRARERTPGFP